MASYNIMIIEDDSVIARTMKGALEQWDYQVTIAKDFKNILEEVEENKPELILLDINLPFYNGFYWCSKIRAINKAPIIFISSADDNMNVVMAMEMGGDDFIAKPFDLTVFTAKIKAMLRRTYDYQGQTLSQMIRVDDVILNLDDDTLSAGDATCELTKNEFKIMKILMEQAGTTVSRDYIMECLWDSNDFIDDNTLNVNVTRIRKKLKDMGIEDFITTKKGFGYLISKESGDKSLRNGG